MVVDGVVVEKVFDIYVCVPPEFVKYEESAPALLPPDATILIGVAVVGLTATSVKSTVPYALEFYPPIMPAPETGKTLTLLLTSATTASSFLLHLQAT